jgi:hypothetical protein
MEPLWAPLYGCPPLGSPLWASSSGLPPLGIPFWAQPLAAPCGCYPLAPPLSAPVVHPHTCTVGGEWIIDGHYTALSLLWLLTYWRVEQAPTAPLQGGVEPIRIVRRGGKQSDDVTLIAWSRVKQALFTPLDTLPPRTDTVALTLTLTETWTVKLSTVQATETGEVWARWTAVSGGTRGLNAHLVNDWTLLCSAATLPRSVDITAIFSVIVSICALVSGYLSIYTRCDQCLPCCLCFKALIWLYYIWTSKVIDMPMAQYCIWIELRVKQQFTATSIKYAIKTHITEYKIILNVLVTFTWNSDAQFVRECWYYCSDLRKIKRIILFEMTP